MSRMSIVLRAADCSSGFRSGELLGVDSLMAKMSINGEVLVILGFAEFSMLGFVKARCREAGVRV